MHKIFLASADHVSPRYRFRDHPVRVRPAPGHAGWFFATSDGLGCSKDYPTEERAARSLFEDNACFDIKLQEVAS